MAWSGSAFRVGLLIGIVSFRLLLSCAAGFAQWSCGSADPTCKSAFVVHDSWHAAIVLKRLDIPLEAIAELADFPQAEFVEFSWGDRDYFPNPQSGVIAAIKAALWSGGSVIHLVGFTGSVEAFYRSAKITELQLTARSYEGLLAYLSETFARPSAHGRAQASPGLYPYSRFYSASRKFSALRTCNTWVAEALEKAELPISPGFVITAGNLESQLLTLKPAR